MAVGALTLTACNSTPSTRRQLRDTIQSFDLPAGVESCWLDVLAGLPNQDIDVIGNANRNLDFSDPNFVATGTDDYQSVVGRFEACGSDSTDPGPDVSVPPAGDSVAPGDSVADTAG
ncbi:hypothetical protein BH24ACT5_BH24ACT5_25670 [soil metagenome]